MNAKRATWVVCVLRAISPAALIAIAALGFLVVSVLEQTQVARCAREIDRQLEVARSQLIAETALLQHAAGGPRNGRMRVAGVDVGVAWHDDLYTVSVSGPNGQSVLTSRQLAGGAPRVFSQFRAATDATTLAKIGGGLREEPDSWPQLDRAALANAPRAAGAPGFRRDPEIALRHLASGSDRPDYVWSSSRLERSRHLGGGLLVVPGNLWLEARDLALQLDLASDLVVVVEGNVYILGSLRVRGTGRLLLATDTSRAGVVFADVDGSGGWTPGDRLHRGAAFAGPVEGTGSVYLGLPGAGGKLACDAGLLVGGELHVAAHADVHGPLLLRFGCTLLGPEPGASPTPAAPARLRQWAYRPGRDRVRGFLMHGKPRPSRLQIRSR